MPTCSPSWSMENTMHGIKEWRRFQIEVQKKLLLRRERNIRGIFEKRWTVTNLDVRISSTLTPTSNLTWCFVRLSFVVSESSATRRFAWSQVVQLCQVPRINSVSNTEMKSFQSWQGSKSRQDPEKVPRVIVKRMLRATRLKMTKFILYESIKEMKEVEVGDKRSKRTEFKISGWISRWCFNLGTRAKYTQIYQGLLYREDPTRICVPDPTIKHSRQCQIPLSQLGGKLGGRWLKDADFFDIVNSDGDSISLQEVYSTHASRVTRGLESCLLLSNLVAQLPSWRVCWKSRESVFELCHGAFESDWEVRQQVQCWTWARQCVLLLQSLPLCPSFLLAAALCASPAFATRPSVVDSSWWVVP